MSGIRIVDELTEYPYDPENATAIIELDLTDEEFAHLAKMAHERDITLNHLFGAIIDKKVREEEARIAAEEEAERLAAERTLKGRVKKLWDTYGWNRRSG